MRFQSYFCWNRLKNRFFENQFLTNYIQKNTIKSCDLKIFRGTTAANCRTMTGRTGRSQANRKKAKNKPLLGRPAERNASAFLSADIEGSAGERLWSGPRKLPARAVVTYFRLIDASKLILQGKEIIFLSENSPFPISSRFCNRISAANRASLP